MTRDTNLAMAAAAVICEVTAVASRVRALVANGAKSLPSTTVSIRRPSSTTSSSDSKIRKVQLSDTGMRMLVWRGWLSVRWVPCFLALNSLLSVEEVPIRTHDSFLKSHLGPPSEGAEAGAIHQLSGCSVGLGEVPAYLAPIADDASHSLGQFSDRQISP